jgi:hypothetical protein
MIATDTPETDEIEKASSRKKTSGLEDVRSSSSNRKKKIVYYIGKIK